MTMGTAAIIRANARAIPLADESVDLVVTSPPYFSLRSYQDGGEHYAGQVGDEPTPGEFIGSLLDVTRECVRVLKPTGSLFVNLGDKYAGGGLGGGGSMASKFIGREGAPSPTSPERAAAMGTARPKSLIGIPWRYAIACVDELGLILRAEVIWSKPNGLPESVTDRVRRSHEHWFHFTLQPRYFSAVDEIREVYTGDRAPSRRVKHPGDGKHDQRAAWNPHDANPAGALPGSVWVVPTEPLRVPPELGIEHYAAFPTEWPRRIIAGWSPAGICVECGEGRRPTHHTPNAADHVGQARHEGRADAMGGIGSTSQLRLSGGPLQRWRAANPTVLTGYACACDEPTADTRPAVVLDPFGGTGTTALVAKTMGRHGISVDMSADYCRLADWRTNNPEQLAAALRLAKPPKQTIGQESLFDQ